MTAAPENVQPSRCTSPASSQDQDIREGRLSDPTPRPDHGCNRPSYAEAGESTLGSLRASLNADGANNKNSLHSSAPPTRPDEQFSDIDTDLLAYFQNTVCPIMLPSLDDVRNPWLQIYIPMALHNERSQGRTALRHALMSVAASHLTQRDDSNRARYHERANFHQDRATDILTSILSHDAVSMGAIEKCTILAAALTLITAHIWGHGRTDCNTFLNLAKRLAHATGGDMFWKSSVLTCILFQLLRAYDLVAATAQLQAETFDPDQDWGASSTTEGVRTAPSADALDSGGVSPLAAEESQSTSSTSPDRVVRDKAAFLHMPYILDTSFGISSQTMSLLHELVRLRSSYEPHLQSSRPLPESLLHATDLLAEGLYSVGQDKSAFGGADGSVTSSLLPSLAAESTLFEMPSGIGNGHEHLPKPIMEEVMDNYQWAFHHAVVLYFHRVVPPSYFSSIVNGKTIRSQQMKSTPAAKEDCQSLVRKIFDRLENIDCLTEGTKVRPSVALWPAFIAAVEAMDVESRHRALIWFSKAAKRGIGNIPRAKDIVMATWRATDRRTYGETSSIKRGLGPIDWRLIMKDSGSVIMLA
ncbi:hypothetical protein A1O3_01476 [Capronia epimyces CBS 606.96]|uniref:Transcription factor domain-containing protein n=1 Tax=Capronia epimyces CBS 606.96 TaxID=1182542 RepID=W9YTD9_9EURO|nr:uncharacterized protein A1O3_01476 [Capronia epimyces CBS 606.96]EXJ92920.1 hypothetical protein A1O3_01476 [Capronia epimyces CBS 606.96]